MIDESKSISWLKSKEKILTSLLQGQQSYFESVCVGGGGGGG